MFARSFLCWAAILGASCLLTSCESKLEVLLYNGTETLIVLHSNRNGGMLNIAPHAVADVTGDFSMVPEIILPEITQARKTYRYSLPLSPIPASYEEIDTFKIRRCFEFASDHRLYILPDGKIPGPRRPPQPVGFPLAPN